MGLSTTFIQAIGFGLTLSLLYEAVVPEVGTQWELMKTRIILFLSSAIFFAAQGVLSGQNYSHDFTKQSQTVYYEVWVSGQRVARKFKTRKEAEDYVKAYARQIRCAGETVSRNCLRKGDKGGSAMAKEISEDFSCYYLNCVKIKEVPVTKGVSVTNGNTNNSMPWQQNTGTTVSGVYSINQMEALSYFEPMSEARLQKMVSNREYTEKATPEDKERMIKAWYMEASAKDTGRITSEEATAWLSQDPSLSHTVNVLAVRTQRARVSSESRQPGLNKTMSELGKTGLGILLNEVQNPEVRARIFDTLAQNCKNKSDGRIDTDILKSSIDYLMQQKISNASQANKALAVQNQQGLNRGNSDKQNEKARLAAMKALDVYRDMCQKGFCKN